MGKLPMVGRETGEASHNLHSTSDELLVSHGYSD
jgi:hypothetical protein